MRSRVLVSLFLLVLLAGSFLPAGLAQAQPLAGPPWYAVGQFQGWTLPGTLLWDDGSNGDDVAGDGIYTILMTVASPGRYEWKVCDGTWNDTYPPSNAWFETTVVNQSVKLTFDTNTYSDGWYPTHNIVNAQDGVAAWTAVGDWQGWSNADPATAMVSLGSGLYAYTTAIAAAGTHQLKVCRTGSWDAVGSQGTSGGRSVNTDNLDFNTTAANQLVHFLLNANTGRIRVQLPPKINELRADQTGTDNDEYFELAGEAGASLEGLTYIVIGDGTGGSGVVETVASLAGAAVPADGLFFAAESTFSASLPIPDLVFSGNVLNFENNDNVTHMLVSGFTGALNQDLDTNDDGILDITPWTFQEDCVALLYGGGGSELVYCATTVGPDGSFAPGHVYLCPDTGWHIGPFNIVGGMDTPGTPNPCVQPTPDVTVAKVGPAYVSAAGGDIDYVLTYALTGAAGAQGIRITDTLPAGLTLVTFTSLLPVTLTSVSPVVFDAGSLAGLGSNVITLTANVPALPFGTYLTNTVAITCSGDAVPDNNEDSWTTIVVGSEISLAKTGDSFVLPGQAIAYTLSYTVQGDPAQGVVLTDTLPAAVTYVSDTAPVIPTEPISGTLVWNMGTVTASGSFLVYGLVSSNPMTWTLHNVAEIAAANDTDPGNNQASWDTLLPLPIQQIQYTTTPGDGTYPSPLVGQSVWTIGAVIADEVTFGSPNIRILIQDPTGDGPWDGVLLYYSGASAPNVNVGDLLLVYGTVAEYGGVTEIALTAANTTVLQPGVAIVPTPIPTADLVSGEVAESYESVLIQFSCASVTKVPDQYGEWGVTDASGEQAAVGDWGTYAYSPTLGDNLTMVAVGNYSFSEYKAEPRSDADIVLSPGVAAHGPVDGAVPVGSDVWATFNMAMDATTVSTATFLLEGPAGPLAGAVSYDAGTWTATLNPDADLDYATAYTATLTTGIASEGGTPLCAAYIWSFTTEGAPAPDLTPSTKEADRLDVQAGDPLTYTITLENGGEITASAVLTDVLPAEVTVLTPTLPPGMVLVGGELLWSGEVDPGQSLPLSFQVVVDAAVPVGTWITNTVWIADGVNLFTREALVEVTGEPDVAVAPLSLSALLQPGQSVIRNLTISNVGQGDLYWALLETAGWLSESPSVGQIVAGEQTIVAVTFDASGLSAGTYTTTLTLASNDPDEPELAVDVTLTVTTQAMWHVYLPVVTKGTGR